MPMHLFRLRLAPILVLAALLRAGPCSAQSGPASTRESFEQIASEPASVRLSKLFREAKTIVHGTVEGKLVVAEPDGRKRPEYIVSVTECFKMGEPFCPVPDGSTVVRVRTDTDPLSFTAPDLSRREHYILFLCHPAESAYYITCGNQGIFRIARTSGDWAFSHYAVPEDEIEVLSGVPSFSEYNRMTYWELIQELSYVPQFEIPLTRFNVELLVATQISRTHVARIIEECKVNFALNPEIEEALRKAGADDEILAAVARSGPPRA